MSKNYVQLISSMVDGSAEINLDIIMDILKGAEIDLQDDVLLKILASSEKINKSNISTIEEYRKFEGQRKTGSSKKRKIVTTKKPKPDQKKHFCDKINDYQEEIKKIISLNFENFKIYVDELCDSENINFLMLGIVREITSYQKMSDEAYLNKDKDLILEVKEIITGLKEMLDYLKMKEFAVEDKKESFARIIFLETSSLRSYFMEDIEGDIEYYDSYAYLFSHLERGKPKDVRYFSNNEGLKGLTETKHVDGKTRICYDRIDENTYVIIDAFIKKDDNSLAYRNQLINRYKIYTEKKSYILAHLNDEDFIKRQNDYLCEVKKLLGLGQGSKVKEKK